MKVLKKILLITSISIGVLYNISFAKTGKVLVEATRIREEANINSNIVTVIYENEEVEILEESGEWYKIKYKDSIGYAKQNFFKVNDSNNNSQNEENAITNNTSDTTNVSGESGNQVLPPIPENVENPNQVSQQEQPRVSEGVNHISVNSNVALRSLPSFMSSVIEQLDTSKNLTKIGEMNKWVQVTDGYLTGWIPNIKITTKITQPPEPQETITNKRC